MKRKIFIPLLFLVSATTAQDFVKITGPNNPINSLPNTNPYRGAAWIDFNNDGLTDLHVSDEYIFQNVGNGQFVWFTGNLTSGASAGPASASWADYDNDGDIDCFMGGAQSRLFRNDGTGQFTLDAGIFPISNNYVAWAAALGEVNNDGRVDLCIAYANGFHPGTTPTPCWYFLQDSSGHLQQASGYDFTTLLRPYTVPYFSDYDLDGDMDLFIASGPGGSPALDYCYRNLKIETGLDTLERITNTTFAQQVQDGQCYNFIDIDNDGDLDLCLTNWFGAPSRLYKNDNGGYTSVLTPFTNTATRLSNCWGDYDNDGDLDVIISTNNAPVSYYTNDGNGLFTPVSYDMTTYTGGACIINSDYDNDGDLDAFIGGVGTARGQYLNDSLSGNNHWINITCEGSVSNRTAIGTIIRLKSHINGQDVWQIREINSMNSFQGHNDHRVHFGLGDATVIDSLMIRYPSGILEVFTNVSSDNFYYNVENSGTLSNIITSEHSLQRPDKSLFKIHPNPAADIINITRVNDRKINTLICSILDQSGKVVHTRRYFNTESISLNVSNLQSGVYFIRIEYDNNYQVLKFIKEGN